MTDDERPPAWVPIVPIDPAAAATPPGWDPDGSGSTRWWDGSRWTDHVAGSQPAVTTAAYGIPAMMPVRAQPRSGWIAGGVALVVLVLVSALGVAVTTGSSRATRAREAALSAGTADYYTFTGPLGRPMAVGAPWGQACSPVLVDVADDVPDAVYAEVVRVVVEARADGIEIGLENRQRNSGPGDLPVPDLRNVPVAFVSILADTDVVHRLPDGQPERDSKRWGAAPDPNGRTEHLTTLFMTLHLATLGDSRREYRRALRNLVGWSQGISDSTSPNSALPNRDTDVPDAFSPADIAAMKVMSGCAGL